MDAQIPSHDSLRSLWQRYSTALTTSLSIVVLGIFLFASCSSGLSREQRRVRKAAVKCYEMLQDGKYDKFVGQIAYADSMSEDYRSQMIDLVHEYAASLKEKHGKITQIHATNDVIQDNQAHVFLQLGFTDSTVEEIGVPMVKVGRKWRMQ